MAHIEKGFPTLVSGGGGATEIKSTALNIYLHSA